MVFGHSLLISGFGLDLNISNNVAQRVNVCKFLGIFIDEKLSWCNHIDHICSKLAKAVSMIRVARLYRPHNVLLCMFHAFVMPYLVMVCLFGVILFPIVFIVLVFYMTKLLEFIVYNAHIATVK